MRIFFLISISLISNLLYSQQKECDCVSKIDYVSHQIESNSASFAHQVKKDKRTVEYNKHKKQVKEIAEKLKTQKECIGLIQYYLSFLRDAHQKLHLSDDYYTFKDSIGVKNFIINNVKNYPIINIKPKGLLGNWIFNDRTFSIQIQKNKEKGRKFIGVLVKNAKYYNQKGDLKIEFYENYKGDLYAVYWNFKQKPTAYKVKLSNNKLSLGRTLEFNRDESSTKKANQYSLPDSIYFEEMSKKTNYLRINSFGYEKKNEIDSILKTYHSQIVAKPNLIIDVRNNGGGSDLSYYSLLPYIMDSIHYANPISASIWVSKDNYNDYNY